MFFNVFDDQRGIPGPLFAIMTYSMNPTANTVFVLLYLNYQIEMVLESCNVVLGADREVVCRLYGEINARA